MSLYEHAFRRLLYPGYEGLRGRRTLQHLGEYQANQWRSPEEIAGLQWAKLKALVEHCWREVPYYRARWQAIGFEPGDLRSMSDYARLPVLTKADIRENFHGLQARSLGRHMLYKATGGSTGEPLRFGYTRESNDRRAAVMWRGYGWTGARMGRRSLFLWGGAVGDPGRGAQLKERLYHAAFHRRMLNSFLMRDDNMAAYADAIAAYRPEVIVAYVDPVFRLSRWLLEHGRSIPGVATVLGAAEALHDYQRSVIEAAFPGAKAYNTYGCREFMLIAAECPHRGGLHVNADHLVVELAGAANGGGAGDLVVTDLHNYGMPLLRYANGDMARPGGDSCACGRGLPKIASVEGRKLDVLQTADGRQIFGEHIVYAFLGTSGVDQWQVVQDTPDAWDVYLVPGRGFGPDAIDRIARDLQPVCGEQTALRFHLRDAIALTPAGKRRPTINNIAVGGTG